MSLGEREPLAILDLMSGLGASPNALKALVRPLLTGPLTVVDYSAIEARVLAWLAGEQWVLDAFRDGQDLYVETARRFGPQFTRQHGKVAVLALGYGGAVGALRNMGAKGEDNELRPLVDLYRSANPKIKQFWYDAWDTFQSGGECGRLTVKAQRGVRTIVLPSGREIVYRGVHRATWADEDGTVRKGIAFRHPTGKTPKLWFGIIAENCTQAVARDLLAYSLPKLEAAGVPTVAHVHDEIVADGDHLEAMAATMTDLPAWAAGLPLSVGGWCDEHQRNCPGHVVERYTK
jgi:DNA polymerase